MNGARNLGLLAGLALCGPAAAADFGVMESAEAIEPKAFKVSGFPLLRDRRDAADNDGAFAASLGYGLPYGLDIEGLVARYEQSTFLGTDIEWNAWNIGNLAFSFGGGMHRVDLDGGGDANGLDTFAIVTWTPVHRLDLNMAFDASYEDVNGRTSATERTDRYRLNHEFETYYIAPGVEYALTRDIDLLVEIGLGLNGDADDYAGAGIAWYLTR